MQDSVDLGWQLTGSFGAFQGASIDDILRPYFDAERLADWDKARAEHGDDAHTGHLPRSEAQRRADALWRIFQDAAAAEASPVGVDFVHHVVWDAATFEETLRRLSGEQPRPFDPESSTCRTIDGVPLEPTEAGANALVSHFRRVVIDSSGVVIDLGRARLFTGGSRLAVQLSEERHFVKSSLTTTALDFSRVKTVRGEPAQVAQHVSNGGNCAVGTADTPRLQQNSHGLVVQLVNLRSCEEWIDLLKITLSFR